MDKSPKFIDNAEHKKLTKMGTSHLMYLYKNLDQKKPWLHKSEY